ncbi:MAG: sigma-70 family RNA polymerase sigma factor [Chitinophagaceae bacterium]|nr:sigma-70 family RNA polymerase sigma factor [Chitinophagaceae bacterium]
MSNLLQPEKWVVNYSDYLFNHALYRINDVEQAEDLVQETFLSAYKSKALYKGEASEKTWLVSILKNKIIDYYRKKASLSKTFDLQRDSNENFFFEQEDGHWKENTIPADLKLDPHNQLQQKELANILLICFEKLPEMWNQILKLKLIDQEKSEALCKTFNISSSNLWVIVHRAKLQLRDCLQQKLHA